jgi:hypothetical protein
MSFDSNGQTPSLIDSTDYSIWGRQRDGNRALFTSYGNPHPHVGNFYPAVLEPCPLGRRSAFFQKCRSERPPMSPVVARAEKKPRSTWDGALLVKACLAGNEQAWSLLIVKYKALIYSIPDKYDLPPHEASSVLQSTRMELLRRLSDLREPETLPKWLMQVARHQYFRVKRQQQRLVSRDVERHSRDHETPAIAESIVQQTLEE